MKSFSPGVISRFIMSSLKLSDFGEDNQINVQNILDIPYYNL